MIREGFRGSSHPTLGVELELQIIDAGTLGLVAGGEQILERVPEAIRSSVKPEFHSCCVEVSTGICRDVDEARRDLDEKLRMVTQLAATSGMLLGWSGTHPYSHWNEQVVTDDRRYRKLADLYQETLRRQLTFGLHVHVGVESGDAAIRACDAIRPHLPVLLALSVNSPFWCGRVTGLQSYRLDVMNSLPAGNLPPLLGSWHDYGCLIDELERRGQIESCKDLWWDVRPSPAFGTVEVRIFDMPASLESVLGLAAVVQCLIHTLASSPPPSSATVSTTHERACELILRQNRWLAARHGLDAVFIDPLTDRKARAKELARELIDRLIPTGRELGCAAELHDLRTRLLGPSDASRQLSAYERSGDLADVVRLITGAAVAAPCALNSR